MNVQLRRGVLVLYLLVVLFLTLWPNLKLPEMDIQRPDLLAHAGMFGLMTLLFTYARVGGAPTLGGKNLITSGLLSLAIASTIEAAQGLPFIKRVSGLDDGVANAIGVLGATALCFVVAALDDQKRLGSGS